MRRWWLLIAGLLTIAGLAATYHFWPANPGPHGTTAQRVTLLLDTAQASAERGQLADAELQVMKALALSSDHPQALLLAGRLATTQNRFDQALAYFDRVSDQHPDVAVEARCQAAAIYRFHFRRLSDAEGELQRALQLDASHLEANAAMAGLYLIVGRRWESRRFDLALIKQGEFTPRDLVWFGMPTSVVFDSAELQACLEAKPDDPLPLLGIAQVALADNRPGDAEILLRRLVAERPALIEAHVQLGRSLVDQERWQALREWHVHVPIEANAFPDMWVVRARMALQQQDATSATRCYLEAARRDPDHSEAVAGLATLLHSSTEAGLAARVAQRAALLDELLVVIQRIDQHAANLSAIRRAAELSEELGRLWEGLAWSSLALRQAPELEWPQKNISRLRPRLASDTPITLDASNPARDVDFALFPRGEFLGELPNRSPVAVAAEAGIRFENVSASLGITFQYFNGEDPTTAGTKMYEVNGGGIGILDYDRDGWPDLYFTQGCQWPSAQSSSGHLDAIYRNREGDRFEEVAEAAHIVDPDFGQGVTVGDFDNDGFPDLYIANIGNNRLLHNQGDGTYLDITAAAGLDGPHWTTSCAMADINSDGLPDLYDVNYLKGEDLFERTCVHEDGVARVCLPKDFEVEPDRLYLNGGDGTFLEQSRATGIASVSGPGLGVVVADLDGSGIPSIFVANDGVRNFHFRNFGSPDRLPQFQEQGILSGLAFDATGKSQACMGIAVGEVSGDDRLDLLVTNFVNELNCFYVQDSRGQFRDATRESGLDAGSYQVLGFGTEFIDADLDGRADLVIANGQVVDRSALNEPYQMRPQFYRNLGEGRFREQAAATLGPYFEQKHVGRALARLDWNRDGREDFAVTHLHEPAALLGNKSQAVGNFVSLRLIGVHSARDGIGCKVTVVAGERRFHQQLTAGGGFQVSNQRILTIGLGTSQQIGQLDVQWPSGQEQTWTAVPLNRELIVIEGNRELVSLARENE